MRRLQLGDVVHADEILVLAEGARIELEDPAGATFVPRHVEVLDANALPAGLPAEGASRNGERATAEIDRVIESLESGVANEQDAPAAGLTADAGGNSGLPPGLRVERITETIGSRSFELPTNTDAAATTELGQTASSADQAPGTLDATAPTLTISAADVLLAPGDSTTLTFSFSEPVSGFDASDITVTGGIVSGLTQIGLNTWTATFTQSGSDRPSIAVTAGSYTDLAGNPGSSASVTLTADIEPPVIDLDASQPGTGYAATFTENGSPVSIGDIDLRIDDPDSPSLTGASVTLSNPQPNDVLSFGSLPAGISASVSGHTITFSGVASLADYEAAIRAVTFSNASDAPATVDRTVTVTVTDRNGNTSAPATAVIQVQAVNDAPVAQPDAATTAEDTPVTIAVLANDSDVDGDALSVSAASATHGAVLIHADGSLTYTPNANFHGTDTITYTVSDG
ncbi:Ig-like domain-containing protein, partial [Caldimonas manganoxidans]|uniref:Ig-like domain-containing protein n=1 Tax=Caldimonas manganoxidans TaxID=196015 RepID=UPI0005265144